MKKLPQAVINHLQGIGFVHVTGLRIKVKDSQGHYTDSTNIEATRSQRGKHFPAYMKNFGREMIVTTDGQVWYRENFRGKVKKVQQRLLQRLCPNGTSNKDCFLNFDVSILSCLSRLSDPYKGLKTKK